jgi:spermidine synthase
MSNPSMYARIPLPLLFGTGAVVFLANAGLLVLQLVGSRFLAPFIGSSVETWTSVIGVFLTGIALGNWFGGRIADRFPSPRTVGVVLILSGLSAFGMIACYEYSLSSGFYKSISLGQRILALAFMFCLLPAFLLSLLTPLTIKLILPDIGSAGRIAGLIFALSTLGCLIGNYFTGFWLMAHFELNSITAGVGIGLIALAIPVFFIKRENATTVPEPLVASRAIPEERPIADGAWDFRNNIRIAYLVVFLASFCGMSLELTGSRVLAPIVGVSLYTWTGIIGVMLAGTCCGNYLGGILADRGVGPAVRRFALLAGFLIGAAVGTISARQIDPGLDCNAAGNGWFEYPLRLAGAIAGVIVVIPGLFLSRMRGGALLITAIVGGLIGIVLAHTAFRAVDKAFDVKLVNRLTAQSDGALLIHGIGFITGAAIALLFVWDAPKKGEPVSRSGALSGSLFLAGLMTLAILMLTGIFTNYDFIAHPPDIVDKVMIWTFGLFFVPMLMLGTISPQVIRLSVPDIQSAGRVAGSVYAWSTAGAIAGTFATGYFLIGAVGTFRVLMILAFGLTLVAFFVGRLWKNNAMLYAASIVCGGGIFGLFVIGYGSNRYDLETKYYAIRVTNDDRQGLRYLSLDHLLHSVVNMNDPTWLYYPHEYVQGELLMLARSRGGPTNVLIIGGGGYTFPRYVDYLMPDVNVEVVEIDPGVTEIAHRELGLPRDTRIRTHHMDGRQFVSERAAKGHYQIVAQDAVNDLSVPYHLMTKEYNDAIKQTLTPDGAYLLTLIDSIEKGKLWSAAVNTMRETFKYVHVLSPTSFRDAEGKLNPNRNVYVIYGSDTPLKMTQREDATLDTPELRAAFESFQNARQGWVTTAAAAAGPMVVYALPSAEKVLEEHPSRLYTNVLDEPTLEQQLNREFRLKRGKKLVLTDQYCPVDNLMSEVFRERGGQ